MAKSTAIQRFWTVVREDVEVIKSNNAPRIRDEYENPVRAYRSPGSYTSGCLTVDHMKQSTFFVNGELQVTSEDEMTVGDILSLVGPKGRYDYLVENLPGTAYQRKYTDMDEKLKLTLNRKFYAAKA